MAENDGRSDVQSARDESKGTYVLGESGREVERLTKQHKWVQLCLKNKIIFVPLDLTRPDLKILDVGCANGMALRDIQKEVPSTSELVGTDLIASYLPPSPEGNITYRQGSFTEPFDEDLRGHFDLTTIRFSIFAGAGIGLDKTIVNLVDSLAPGGWLQIHEVDVKDKYDEESAFNDTQKIMRALITSYGVALDFPTQLTGWMEAAGLENVKVDVVDMPAGMKLGNKEDAAMSVGAFKLTVATLSEASQKLNCDLPPSVHENLLERFEKEMMETGAYYKMVIAYGQKKQ